MTNTGWDERVVSENRRGNHRPGRSLNATFQRGKLSQCNLPNLIRDLIARRVILGTRDSVFGISLERWRKGY